MIDPGSNTHLLTAQTKEHGQFFQRLHALDITTGAEKFGGPVTIQATYPGTGDGSSGGMITFDPLHHLNRSGLIADQRKRLYCLGLQCDKDPFHGWVMAYDQSTLQQTAVWMDTPNGGRGGIWMSGAGLAADAAGNLFIATGNGTFDTSGTVTDFGDSIVKLTLNGNQLAVADYFTPYDQLNSGRTMTWTSVREEFLLLPDQPGSHVHELIAAGQRRQHLLVDRDNMGQYNPNDNSQIVQNLTGEISGMFSTPTYWNNNVYFGSGGDRVKAFSLTNGLLSTEPTSQSPTLWAIRVQRRLSLPTGTAAASSGPCRRLRV